MEHVRHLIVGAGVTGLSFANFTPGDDWLVLEAQSEPGGYCKTIKQDGFVWDFSGHFFHFRNKDLEQFLRDRMPGQVVETIEKSAGILFEGQRIDFPFQKNIHQLPEPHFKECLDDLMNRDAERPQNSFLDMLYARLGKGICEKFLVPYNEKLYACSLDTLDVDAMGRFFPHANVEEIVANFSRPKNQSYNAAFSYPQGGAIEYVNALLHDLPEKQISYNEALVSVDLESRTATTTQRQIRFEQLVSAVPFPKMLQMSGLRFDEQSYTWNKVLVFNLGFDRKGWTGDHWLYIPSPDISFYRVGFYDNIFDHDRMSLYIEIGMNRHEEVGSIDAHLERVLADLETLGITNGHQLVSSHNIVLDPAYVHITKASQADFQTQSNLLKAHGVHSIGRYGGWTYCSIEDNMIEARQLAQNLG